MAPVHVHVIEDEFGRDRGRARFSWELHHGPHQGAQCRGEVLGRGEGFDSKEEARTAGVQYAAAREFELAT